jgi:hypothetical protein
MPIPSSSKYRLSRRSRPSVTGLVAALVSAAALAVPASAQTPSVQSVNSPYSARYAVYRNGKLQARAEFLLEEQDDNWIMKSESIGTHGMARFLKFKDHEYLEGELEEGQFRPLRYSHELKWIGPDQNFTADFNWEDMKVRVVEDGNEVTLDLVPGAVDPMTLQLEIRSQLASPEPDLEFMLVEEDEIERQLFRALPDERLETSLGCLETRPVEKVRVNSTRYTRSWHASDFNFIPVRMEHGKTDGDRMELRIIELTIKGARVEPQPGCAASQSPSQGD